MMRVNEIISEVLNPKASYPLQWDNTFGPVERHASARIDANNWIIITFVPRENTDMVEVEFSKNDRWDISGTGDQYRTLATVVQAFREYLQQYKPKMFYFLSDSSSRSKAYQAIINRLVHTIGYKQFDTRNLSQQARDKITSSGKDIFIIRRSYAGVN